MPFVLHLRGTVNPAALVDEPGAVVADGGFIRPGFNGELDGYVALATTGKDYLAKLEARERTVLVALVDRIVGAPS